MADDRFDVVVIGSCFVDMISYVPRLPESGETIKGTKFQLDFGGKAANQCVMAQKLGANTAMVAKVGNDQFGKDTRNNFKRFGVNTDFIAVTDKAETGVTNIAVNNSGEPAFISLAGANRHLSVEDIKAAELFIKSCQVVICDKGIPLKIAEAALQYSKELGKKTLFNPSPKLESLPRSIYLNADSLIVNREEGESLTNMLADDIEGAKKVICKLHQWGAKQIVLTLGSEGAVSSEISSQHGVPVMVLIPTQKVEVVDTTGAGDALIGALAFYMSCYPQLSFAEMVFRAVNIATVTVTAHGVQASYPAAEQLDKWLFDNNARTSEQLGLVSLNVVNLENSHDELAV
ncbi:unnamed protein product [Porites lobata]|uniref:Ribokinase n=1 Tax=Porites lobata TaxID=104759 RepID=A0ABN8NUB5_9CNID|nr:unnamed protein product [Porites lobata]